MCRIISALPRLYASNAYICNPYVKAIILTQALAKGYSNHHVCVCVCSYLIPETTFTTVCYPDEDVKDKNDKTFVL